MQSGDGLLVRIRPRCGALNVGALIAIADAAERYGNGLVDLTRRANLQVRGLAPERLEDLWGDLAPRGLIDENAEVESVRNVMVTPLAPPQVAAIAQTLEAVLAAEPGLWRLPGKFCFLLDDTDSVLPLDAERADVRLLHNGTSKRGHVAIGCDRSSGVVWLGWVPPAAAAAAALEVGRAFLGLISAPRQRMRDLGEDAFARLGHQLAGRLTQMADPPAQRCLRPLGRVAREGRVIAVGVGAPFGRIEARNLRSLAAAALKFGVTDFHLSPWRSLYLPVPDAPAAEELLSTATAAGFIVAEGNPLMAIDACPGAPGCRSSFIDTRAIAVQLAPLLASMGACSCHVSGCAKGCARSKPADLVVVGTKEGVGVMRYDTAQGIGRAPVSQARLAELPELLGTI